MAKKATPKPVPAVVQHAEVSNNINLNLNQNDLIDLAIQEHLEVLEGKIKAVREEIIAKQNLSKELEATAAKDIAKILLKKNASYNKLLELLPILDIKADVMDRNNNEHYPPYRLYASNNLDNYPGEFSYYYNDEYTSLSQATRNIGKGTMYGNNFTSLTVDLRYTTDGLNLGFSKTIPLASKDTKELCKVLEPLENRIFELHKLKFDLQTEYFQYFFGEKRIKAKIVKASLKKTAEGQAILGMLQGATGVKLIG